MKVRTSPALCSVRRVGQVREMIRLRHYSVSTAKTFRLDGKCDGQATFPLAAQGVRIGGKSWGDGLGW